LVPSFQEPLILARAILIDEVPRRVHELQRATNTWLLFYEKPTNEWLSLYKPHLSSANGFGERISLKKLSKYPVRKRGKTEKKIYLKRDYIHQDN
jgi:hypothetical protein